MLTPSSSTITSPIGGDRLLGGSTGQESDGHDWNNLLARWGLLQHDIGIARGMRAIAALVCVASILVAVWTALQPSSASNQSTRPLYKARSNS
jgi:hypothetical protein